MSTGGIEMTGRYKLDSFMGPVLITVAENAGEYKVAFDVAALSGTMKANNVKVEGNTLNVTTSISIRPDVCHMQMDFEQGKYLLSGVHAVLGELKQAVALPSDEKTESEIMIEELPRLRTGKQVKRTRTEVDAEIDRLLAQMTIEEKVGQMSQAIAELGGFIGAEVKHEFPLDERIRRGMVGTVNAAFTLTAIFSMQKKAVNESRLGIPLVFCMDVVHGKDTIFPIPLAWSCSFDPHLVEQVARVAAVEATASGLSYTTAPMVDIGRDPRWGRVMESAGEDPYLGSLMSVAQIRGYQGDDLGALDTIMACLKHYIGYGAAEGGREYNSVEISDTTLRNIYLPPFKAGIEAGAASLMNSFNIINGVPMAMNKPILNDLLRGELGFEGFIISDFGAIDECVNHGTAANTAEAAKGALEASLDVEMATSAYMDNLPKLVAEGTVDEKLVDAAVRRILRYKYECGIMDDPFRYIDPERLDSVSFCNEHLALSRQLARESIVLLKNNGLLPLKKKSRIAIVGPKADTTDMLGAWQATRRRTDTISLRQGMEAAGFDVTCVQGCGIIGEIENGIHDAIEAVHTADVVLLALGEEENMSGEAASRQNITVPEVQMRLARAVKETGKPFVLVLTNGRPLILNWFEENADAILETWFLGSQAGYAIADVLSGDFNPCGKLTMTFPQHAGQIPIYYNHLNTGRPFIEGTNNKFLSKYIDGENTPLYPFGYGLSYTQFQFKGMALSAERMSAGECVSASVTVRNIGEQSGTEIVQLYLRDVAASIARPVKELKAFKRVTLDAGKEEVVHFTITESMLRFYNAQGENLSEPGTFQVMVGNSSDDKDLIYKEFRLTK